MPFLKATQTELGGDDFTIVGLSIDENAEDLEKFLESNEFPYPIFHDGAAWEAKFVTDFGVNGIPALFLFNPDGVLIARNIRGETMPQEVKAAMETEVGSLLDVGLDMKFQLSPDRFQQQVVKKSFDYEYNGEERSGDFQVTAEPVMVEVNSEIAYGSVPEGKQLIMRVYAADFPLYLESLKQDFDLPIVHEMPIMPDAPVMPVPIPPDTYIVVAEAVLLDPAQPEGETSIKTLWGQIGRLGPKG